jgi:hypothetical protein
MFLIVHLWIVTHVPIDMTGRSLLAVQEEKK